MEGLRVGLKGALRASLGEQVAVMVGLRGPDRPVYMAGDPRTPLGPGRETGNERRIHRLDRIRRDSIRAWKGDDRDGAHVLVRECEEERRNTDTYRFLGIRNLIVLYFIFVQFVLFILFIFFVLFITKFLFLYLCN